MSELMDDKIGKDGEYAMELKDGKLRLTAGVDSKGLDAGLYVDLEIDYFLDKLKDVIPGQIDDAVIEMLKVAFK